MVKYNRQTVGEATSDCLNMHFASILTDSGSIWTETIVGFVFSSIGKYVLQGRGGGGVWNVSWFFSVKRRGNLLGGGVL